jgi:hypothetical protein
MTNDRDKGVKNFVEFIVGLLALLGITIIYNLITSIVDSPTALFDAVSGTLIFIGFVLFLYFVCRGVGYVVLKIIDYALQKEK